ncbi:AAA family ATPase [Mycobacterium simiae]|uniref:AAA family ATPase n=1 Tax=Mycobacterium simiae TaxID=1784 RepID=UPI00165ED8FE|nr:AAA family ATPase [Mycobacterium simiae]
MLVKTTGYDWDVLRGIDVVVIADRDSAGRKHAELVAKQLSGIAPSVRIVEAAVGKDFSDHYSAGRTLNELVTVETADADPYRRLVLTAGNQVRTKKTIWWEPALVLRDVINVLAAREGKGKSTVAASWAARETHMGGKVLWIGSEESREHAQAPRLIANGADMSKIFFVDVETDSGTGVLVFPLDLPAIEKVISEQKITMVVLDPCKGLVPKYCSFAGCRNRVVGHSRCPDHAGWKASPRTASSGPTPPCGSTIASRRSNATATDVKYADPAAPSPPPRSTTPSASPTVAATTSPTCVSTRSATGPRMTGQSQACRSCRPHVFGHPNVVEPVQL